MDELVQKARKIATRVLEGELRYNGKPFMEHVDNVAEIVAKDLGFPESCQAAVYLHEATRRHPEVDLDGFPQDVLTMVDGLNKISLIRPKDTRLEAESYKKLIVSYSKDPRVTVIKICDRLEVMRSLSFFPKTAREQKLPETLMLYIPLAHQLGLYNIKREMEDIYLRYAQPEQYRAITNRLKATEKDREKLTQEFIEPLKKTLDQAGIKYKLKVRTKSAYSIYNKMLKQGVDFDGVFDVFAIRFIIDCEQVPAVEKDLCWKVYSYVTEEYEPDTNRLRDWLTNPKPNGYESLHITVKNKEGNYLEVQIRTARMDAMAENGTAAHWAYKGVQAAQSTERWLESVRYTLEHPFDTKPEDIPAPPEDEIFVFTPSGELRILKAGSSVLDFAFSIHSGLGCKCTGGRVNGKAVSIREKLKTGDSIEIMTSKSQRPSQDWLDMVVTSKARSKIKQELDADERREAAEGREVLQRRLKNWKLEFSATDLHDYMKEHKFSSNISFWAAIHREEVDVNDIKTWILQKEARAEQAAAAAAEADAERVSRWSTARNTAGSDDILVLNAKNVKGMEYKMSKCCNPVFGDDVFGFVTRTEGIKIHRISCPNAARLLERYPYRIQKVVWQDTQSGSDFQCTLTVTAEQDGNVLGGIMSVIGNFKASVRSMNVKDNSRNGTQDISLRLFVPSNMELDKIISQIGSLKHVIKVRRS